MEAKEIRKKFLDFFEKRGHKIVPSSSLIPDDPSVLLTTAGMQQFKPYYTGKADAMKNFGSLNTASVQKSFRTSDIDEVGDESHLTFFEMLGNFSFGGYWKEDAIKYGHEFIVKEMGLEIDYVSIFGGEGEIPADDESEKIWKSIDSKIKIKKFGKSDNFWGPTGNEGPCGPTTEIYVNGVEIWNIVFNQYYYTKQEKVLDSKNNKHAVLELLKPLPTQGIDTGMGLERLVMVLQKKKNIFETDLFVSLFDAFEMLPYENVSEIHQRIIVDHVRGGMFLIADGVRPSNKEAGSILRRLMRRVFTYTSIYRMPPHLLNGIIHNIAYIYGEFYSEIKKNQEIILDEFRKERQIFETALKRGLNELKKRYPGPQVQEITRGKPSSPFIVNQYVGKEAADLHQTYGLPVEFIREYLKKNFYNFDEEEFGKAVEVAFKKHQEVSRAGADAKFGGHGLYLKTGEVTIRDESEVERVTRLHTATHLLHAGLRAILGPEVQQDGSDITVERTRFDFKFSRKVISEELSKVEEWVNGTIKKNLSVKSEEMSYEDAVKDGALGFFREKYPPRVSVYTVLDPKTGEVFSKELCGGPHVAHTSEIGHFKILKEESSSAGVRRIRAVLDK